MNIVSLILRYVTEVNFNSFVYRLSDENLGSTRELLKVKLQGRKKGEYKIRKVINKNIFIISNKPYNILA